MTTELREDSLVRDEILYLPVDVIDPDPEQPRLQVDAELADSIAQHGVLQPIQVRPSPNDADRFFIVDGERRWKGAVAAKVKTIPAQITLEVEDVGDRLVRQIVRNEGKPLTPIERAKAYKRIIDARHASGDKKYGVVQLAKEMGKPKSTVSDLVAIFDLDPVWLELFEAGKIQLSHVPVLRRCREETEDAHRRVAERVKGWKAPLEVKQFEACLDAWFMGDDGSPAEIWDDVRDDVDDDAPGGFDEYNSAAVAHASPELQAAHAIAIQIEKHGYAERESKKVKALRTKLDAFPFWEEYRALGFDRLQEWNAAHLKASQSSRADAESERVDGRFGVPHLSHVLHRQAPRWLGDAWNAQSSDLATYTGWLVDVEAGSLMPAAWGSSQEKQIKAVKAKLRESRQRIIDARTQFGEKPNEAEGATDRAIDALKKKRLAERERQGARDAEEKTRRQQEIEARPRPTREHTDAELLDAIERFDLDVHGRGYGDGMVHVDGLRGDWRGANIREALAVAIEACEQYVKTGWNAARSAGENAAFCAVCECTDDEACDGGCGWWSVERGGERPYGVCTRCAADAAEASALAQQYVLIRIHGEESAVGTAARNAIEEAFERREERREKTPDPADDDDGDLSDQMDEQYEDLWDAEDEPEPAHAGSPAEG